MIWRHQVPLRGGAEMKALRVALRADSASFRHPHIQYGRQPSLPMPPPATIYGLMAAARGNYFNSAALRFAVQYEMAGQGNDIEYLHIAEVGPRRASPKAWSGWSEVVNLVAQGTPFERQMHLFPRLTLWLQGEDGELAVWREAFRSPRYTLSLGRSQDLASVTHVDEVDLEESDAYCLAHTLLPWSFRVRTHLGASVLMPRIIDLEDRRTVAWERYVTLDQPVWSAVAARQAGSVPEARILLSSPKEARDQIPVDPFGVRIHGAPLGIVWLTFGAGPGALDPPRDRVPNAG